MFGSRVALLSGGAANLRQGLVSYWRFDDASGSSVADAVGGNTGTWQGTLGSQWGAGKIGGGGVFNGTDNTVLLPGTGPLAALADFSVSLWCNVQGVTSNDRLLEKWAGNATSLFSLSRQGGGALVNWGVNNGTTIQVLGGAGAVYGDGLWHHLVLVVQGLSVTGYRDGIVDAAYTLTGAHNNTVQSIAVCSRNNSSSWGRGAVDEIGFYSRALSATEVQQLYNGGSGLRP